MSMQCLLRKLGIGCLFIAWISIAACSLKPEKVLDSVVATMCKRALVCQPGLMPNEETCHQTLQSALSTSKKSPKVEASQGQLDACLASIEKTDCDKLFGSEPPPDCGFLK